MNLTFQYKILIALAMICLISACAKEFDEEMLDVPEVEVPVVEQVEMDLYLVIDPEIAPLAKCVFDGTEFQFGEDGHLCFDSVLLDKHGDVFVIDAPGYSTLVKYVYPRLNASQVLKIDLMPLKVLSSFSAKDDAIISEGAYKISIPANSMINAEGQIYDGVVTPMISLTRAVFSRYIDQQHNVQYQKNGANHMVSPLAWIDFNLVDHLGNKLEIKEDAKLEFSFKPSFSGETMLSVDAVYFDKSDNKWIPKSGMTSKEGRFVGELSDVGLHVFGVEKPTTLAEVKLLDKSNNPIMNEKVLVLFDGLFNAITVSTDGEGNLRTPLPVDTKYFVGAISICMAPNNSGRAYEYLDMEMLSYEEDLQVLGNWRAEKIGLRVIEGRLLDCDGQVLGNRTVSVDRESPFSKSFRTDSNGVFKFFDDACFSNMHFNVLDCGTNNFEKSIDLKAEVDIDLGDVKICP